MSEVHRGRDVIAREISEAAARLRALAADQWDRPTRLSGWTIADLGRHLVWGQRLQAEAWDRLLKGSDETADPPPVTTDDPRELVEELVAAHTAFMTVLSRADDEALGRPAPLPYGVIPGAAALLTAMMEAGVHRADVEHALDGDGTTLPEDVARAAAMVVSGWLPAAGAASRVRPPGSTTLVLRGDDGSSPVAVHWDGTMWQPAEGTEPTCQISGQTGMVVLFALGRIPPEHPGLTIEGDWELAEDFKRYFPGP